MKKLLQNIVATVVIAGSMASFAAHAQTGNPGGAVNDHLGAMDYGVCRGTVQSTPSSGSISRGSTSPSENHRSRQHHFVMAGALGATNLRNLLDSESNGPELRVGVLRAFE